MASKNSNYSEACLDPAQQKITALDGIRGIAILLVLAVHAYYRGPDIEPGKLLSAAFQFGWSGVELFFVLSGFLITSILLRDQGVKGALLQFWINRIARIFPLYFTMIFFLILLSYAADFGKIGLALDNIRDNSVVFLLFLSNFSELFGIDIVEANKILGPVWSLAIEQQYYLFWPLLVLFTPAAFSRWALLIIYAAIILFRFFYASPDNAIIVYHTTFLHPDGIIIGSLMALWRKELASASKFFSVAWVAALSLVLIIFYQAGSTHYSNTIIQKYGFPSISIFYATLILLAIKSEKLSKFLSTRTLTEFGKYSYSIYLIHWPILIAMDQVDLPAGMTSWIIFFITFSGLMLLFGYLSWIILEKPASIKIKKIFIRQPAS